LRERRNILFLANRLPFPPNKGDKIRTFHEIDHLALSHNVYCACFVDTPDDTTHVRGFQRWCKDIIAIPWNRRTAALRAMRGWLVGRTLTESAYRDKTLSEALSRWTESTSFDAVVSFSTIMAPYALAIPARRHVLDMCDVDSAKWLDYAEAARFPLSRIYRREGRRLRAFEKACIDRFDATTLITPRERRLLDPDETHDRLHVIPNGVALSDRRARPAAECGAIVGFLGSMDYRPNAEAVCWFVRRVWPALRTRVPNARMLIVGRNPTRRVRSLANTAGVSVTGAVKDTGRYLARCRVIVAPLRIARGMQNKVLEAMAARRPVVATSAVAAGLNVRPGHHIRVADDAAGFATEVENLLSRDDLCRDTGDAGYRCSAMHYCWPEAMQRFEQLVLGESPDSAPRIHKAALNAVSHPSRRAVEPGPTVPRIPNAG